MIAEGWKRAKDLFSEALGLPETEREAFLEAQQDEPEILDEVRSLLAAYRDSPEFLENATPTLLAELRSRESAIPFAGRRIGAWELVREIGQGGMGVVWEARRADRQYEQRAAVKLLRASLFSEQDARRFREERQILASLNHPGIARLLDGGMLEDGEPYLVMEYIDGLPLNGWCELHRPSLRQRIELCLEVCSAVEYAHRQLVIHRDLKPANILVGIDGTPKLLDFGIAKLVAEGGSYRTTTKLLTPECASPEQACGKLMSTASDQFSLGVLLYQLLTGRHPFAAPDASPMEALRAICENEPRLPSAVAEKWSRELRGELDAILLQALNKNPAGRYPSVSAFAGDLRAWLDGLPVSAVRPSWWRRSAKLVLRYKALSTAIATAVLMLVTGIVVTSIEARRALRAEQDALAQRDRAENAQQTAQLQRDRAVAAGKSAIAAEKAAAEDRNRAVSESQRADIAAKSTSSINEFLEQDLLAQADPNVQVDKNTKPDQDLKVRTALDRAANRIQGRFEGQPLIEAEIRQTIGKSYDDLGLYAEAQVQIERAVALRRKVLGEHAAETLASMDALALIYVRETHYAQAEAVYKQVLQARRQYFGEDRSETLDTMMNYAFLYYFTGRYPDAESMLVDVVKKRRRLFPGELQELMVSLDSLTGVYSAEGKLAAAEPIALESLELSRRLHGDDHPDTLNGLHDVARIYRWRGDYENAEKLLSEQLERSRRVLGPEHPDTLVAVNDIAVIYRLEGRYEEAVEMLQQLIEVNRRVKGEEGYSTLANRINMVMVLNAMGRFAEAEPLGTKILETFRRVYGEENPGTVSAVTIVASTYRGLGKYREAESLLLKLLETTRRAEGAEQTNLATAMTALGATYVDEGKNDLVEETLTNALAMDRRLLGPSNMTTVACMTSLARLRLTQQRYAEAETLLREAIKGAGSPKTLMWDAFDRQSMLGASLLGQGKYAEAEPLLISGYEGLRKLSPAISAEANFPEAGQRLVRLYTAWGQPEKAAAWRARVQQTPVK
jgi:tetratricopeptide (TPR) repeat protein/tRNA A-37 threonylcarbamoyl transferase component Bud32